MTCALLALAPLQIHGQSLMAPTGPHAVGTVTYDWNDPDRKEGAAKATTEQRQVVVQLWYPAASVDGIEPAPYLPRLDAYRATTDASLIEKLSRIETHAFVDAPLAITSSPYPIFIFSHGWSGSRSFYSTLLINAASHGFVVVGVDHPFMGEVALADGSITVPDDDHLKNSTDAAEEYARDQLLVISKLAELNAGDTKFRGRLDVGRIATSGHSSGFPAAAWAAAVDSRVTACVSFDAGIQRTAAELGLRQPVLLFRGETGSYTGLFERDADVYEKGTIFPKDFFASHDGDFHDVVISGTTHGSFGDWPTLFADTEATRTAAREQRAETGRYVVAFLDRYLRDADPELLRGATGKTHMSVRTSYAPDRDAQTRRAKFDELVRRVAAGYEIPGLSVGIVENDVVIYTASIGVSRLGGTPVTTRSLYHMASITKPFVGTCVMQLVERGKLDLDACVTDYLPYFTLADRRAQDITIRQLVTHTSGMPDVRDYEWDNPAYDEGALEAYVRSISEHTLIADPGEVVRYSNMAYEVLGDVIAKVSGVSFEDYVRDNILQPLYMRSSTVMVTRANPRLVTTGHVTAETGGVRISDVFPYNRKHAPSSTLISNVFDMMRFARAYMNGGELDGGRILDSATIAAMRTPQIPGGPGLSWWVSERHGQKMISHDGGDVGFSTKLVIAPEAKIAVVVCANYDQAPTYELGEVLMDLALGVDSGMPDKPLVKQLRDFKGSVSDFYREVTQEQNIGESRWNRLGYQLMRENDLMAAIAIFEENTYARPNSWNAYDSLGEAYLAAGKLDLAEQSYRKSFALNPQNTNATKMLDDIKSRRRSADG